MIHHPSAVHQQKTNSCWGLADGRRIYQEPVDKIKDEAASILALAAENQFQNCWSMADGLKVSCCQHEQQ